MWKLIKRNKSYSSKFVNVYEDTVQLPSGKIIENYTVVEKPSIVMIVATDAHNNLLILKEYKYAANEVLLTLPAGHLKEKEDPIEAAKRELFEETGFEGDIYESVCRLHEYPTKDLHTVYVIRVKNIRKTTHHQHEDTELLRYTLTPIPKLKDQIKNKEWKISSALAALTISSVLD